MKTNSEYIVDTMLLDKIYLIEIAADFTADMTIKSDSGLIKQAGMADSLLGSLSGSIMSFAKKHIDTSSISSVMVSLAEFLVPAVLFKVNPILGVLELIASQMGFNVVKIVKDIITTVYHAISDKRLPTLDEINSVGKSAVSSVAGDINAENDVNQTIDKSSSMFQELHIIEKQGQLTRLKLAAPSPASSSSLNIPFLGGKKGTGIVENIFGNLFQKRAKGKAMWLMGGFVVWIMKTLLLGAGLIAGAEAVHGLLGGKKETTNQVSQTNQQTQPIESHHAPLTPTGRGQDVHTNDHETSTWIVPLINNSISDTLIAWAEDIYKEFLNEEEVLKQTQAFHNTIDILKAGLEAENNKLAVPKQFKTRKQVVDSFAIQAANNLHKGSK